MQGKSMWVCTHVHCHVGVGDTPLPIEAVGELLQGLPHGLFPGDSDCPWRGKDFPVGRCGF